MEYMEKEQILKGLEPLFEKAEKEGLWFYSNYPQMWVTPKELRELQKEGRYIWGVHNWELRSPYEKISELERQLETLKSNIEKRIDGIKAKISE